VSVTATTTPAYPVGGRDISVDFTATTAANYLKGFFTDAPIGSALKTELVKTGASRLPAFATDTGKTWIFTGDKADVGGVYTLQVEEYTKGTAYGGGYQGSPASFATETILATSTVQIFVGQKVTQKIGVGPDTATLTLFVFNDTSRPATEDAQGFTAPLIDDTKSKKALTAALNPGVMTAVAGLSNQNAGGLVGDLNTILGNMIIKSRLHMQSATYHAAADADNQIPTAFLNPKSPEGLKRSGAEFLRRLDQHMRNDNGGGTPSVPLTPGTGGAAYHVVSATNVADWQNALLITSTGDALDTFAAIADGWRAMTAHLGNLDVHLVADAADLPDPLPPLLNVHRLFLAELQKQGPTAPASVNSGVTTLIHSAGFEEA